MVAFGRPKGERGSYQQWKENNIPPQVVFEILSPGNTQTEMTTIKRRRRSCILEEIWRIIHGEMSISKRYLPFCWEQKQTGRLETLRWRKIIKATTEMATIERRRRWCSLEEFCIIIDGEMSISKSYLQYLWEQTKTGQFDTLRDQKFAHTTTDMTTIERQRQWCI